MSDSPVLCSYEGEADKSVGCRDPESCGKVERRSESFIPHCGWVVAYEEVSSNIRCAIVR